MRRREAAQPLHRSLFGYDRQFLAAVESSGFAVDDPELSGWLSAAGFDPERIHQQLRRARILASAWGKS